MSWPASERIRLRANHDISSGTRQPVRTPLDACRLPRRHQPGSAASRLHKLATLYGSARRPLGFTVAVPSINPYLENSHPLSDPLSVFSTKRVGRFWLGPPVKNFGPRVLLAAPAAGLRLSAARGRFPSGVLQGARAPTHQRSLVQDVRGAEARPPGPPTLHGIARQVPRIVACRICDPPTTDGDDRRR